MDSSHKTTRRISFERNTKTTGNTRAKTYFPYHLNLRRIWDFLKKINPEEFYYVYDKIVIDKLGGAWFFIKDEDWKREVNIFYDKYSNKKRSYLIRYLFLFGKKYVEAINGFLLLKKTYFTRRELKKTLGVVYFSEILNLTFQYLDVMDTYKLKRFLHSREESFYYIFRRISKIMIDKNISWKKSSHYFISQNYESYGIKLLNIFNRSYHEIELIVRLMASDKNVMSNFTENEIRFFVDLENFIK